MRKVNTVFGLILFFQGFLNLIYSQLPNCNNYYYIPYNSLNIMEYNTSTNTTSQTPIQVPVFSGLAVNSQLNGNTMPTFYITIGGIYQFYNGTNWISTGHSSGSVPNGYLCGAGPYIYKTLFNFTNNTESVYRYDGTGNAVLILTIAGLTLPCGITGDATGNFYIVNPYASPGALYMYDPNGNEICTYNFVGYPFGVQNSSFTIVNNILYTNASNGLINGNTVTYIGPHLVTVGLGFASCEIPSLLVNIAPPLALSCTLPSTLLNATTSLPGATYSWAGPGVVSGGNTSSATVNTIGTYTVTVTSSTGCTNFATSTCVVTQAAGLTLNAINSNILCNGANTGSIDITATNGPIPYNYLWNTGATTEDLNGVIAGTYSVVVTDSAGCFTFSTYTLTEPLTALTLNTTTIPALCGAVNGSATVIANGGTGAYTYNWNPLGIVVANAINIPFGTYTVTVNDANACTQTATVIITNTPAITIVNSIVTDVTCLNDNNGAIFIVAANGTAPYSYTWSSGGNLDTEINLYAGSYSVLVTDIVGCSTTSNFILNPGLNPEIDLIGDDLIGCGNHCVNFSIPTNITTGNLQTYQWLIDGTDMGNSPTLNHCFNQIGDYNITLNVVDSSGCTNAITKTNYINIFDFPVAEFSTIIEAKNNVIIIDQSTNVITREWIMGDGNIFSNLTQFNHTYFNAGTFCITLTATLTSNCFDTTTHCLIIPESSNFNIPNSFTPNYDGINEVFFPVGFGIISYKMNIFNNWGDQIFSSVKDDDVWDGKIKNTNVLAEQGVYVYKIIITNIQNKEYEFIGHVNLIR